MDHLTPKQKLGTGPFFGDNSGWGFGMAVITHRDHLATIPGRFGWDGGYGTSGYSDPREEMIGVLMTQHLMNSPWPPHVFLDFWTSAYGSIDD